MITSQRIFKDDTRETGHINYLEFYQYFLLNSLIGGIRSVVTI